MNFVAKNYLELKVSKEAKHGACCISFKVRDACTNRDGSLCREQSTEAKRLPRYVERWNEKPTKIMSGIEGNSDYLDWEKLWGYCVSVLPSRENALYIAGSYD